MSKAGWAALFLCSLAAWGARAEEGAQAAVTVFQLRDGSKIEALRYSIMTGGNARAYLIINLEGKQQVVVDKDIVSKSEESVPLNKLSEKGRQEVSSMRSLSAPRVEPEAPRSTSQETTANRRRLNDLRAALKKAEDSLAKAQTERAKAEIFIREAPVSIAKADAEYDSAKAELSGTTTAPQLLNPNGVVDHQRSDYLRSLMVRAAEMKVDLQQKLRDAQDMVAHGADNIRRLRERVAETKDELEAAESGANPTAQKSKEERERENLAEPGQPLGSITLLTFKDGSEIRAQQVLEDADGRLAVKDELGKVHFLLAQDVVKREQLK
jgi:hypothetical protein